MSTPVMLIGTPDEMEGLGARLASAGFLPGVVYLSGELGAGKTTLVRGWLWALGHASPVKSPTYTLIEPYDLREGRVLHVDLYRLATPEELEYLGLEDELRPRPLILIEWPEKGVGRLPEPDLHLRIEVDGDHRCVTIEPRSDSGELMIMYLKSNEIR